MNLDSATGWRTVASATASQDYLSTVWDLNAKLSYVTGSHNLKWGLNHEWGDDRNYLDNRANMSTLTFANGVPTSVTVRNTPVTRYNTLNADSGVFAQDRWTKNRLTLFGGFRYDVFKASIPDQTAPANPFVPARDIAGKSCQPCFNDWSIRGGASFDLFGNSKTALKTSIGKFLQANALGTTSSLNPLGGQSNTRPWNDLDHNGRAVDANGNIQFNEIGATTNNNFGLPAGSLQIDPDLKRGNNWEETVSVQHELRSNISVTVGYYRRQFYNDAWTKNTAVDPVADFTPFTIVGPTNPNLPDGGGEVITLYNLNDNKRGAVNSVRTNSFNNSTVYNGFELSVNARHGRGFAFGSMTTERTATNNCTDLIEFGSEQPAVLRTDPAVQNAVQGVGVVPAALRDPGGGHVPGAAGDSAGRGLHGDERGRRPAADGWRRQSHGQPHRPDDHLLFIRVHERFPRLAPLPVRQGPGAGIRRNLQSRERFDDFHPQRDLRAPVVQPDRPRAVPALPVRISGGFLSRVRRYSYRSEDS